MIIRGHELEYIDRTHTYLVDGVIVPSVTQILKTRFGGMYSNVDRAVLEKAAEAGTRLHYDIQRYCEEGIERDSEELRGFKFLERQYGFTVKQNEVPVILFDDGEPIAAGRCDLVIEHDGRTGGADIKRTATLNKEYVAYQLNAYRAAYYASYGVEWDFIWAIHLKGQKRRIAELPVNEKALWDLIDEWRRTK